MRGSGTRRSPASWVAPLVVAVFLLLSACGERGSEPAGAADAAVPQRVVALSPSIAAILQQLGAADRVVGRHAYDVVLPKSIPVAGDQAGIDYEVLARLKPDTVLVEWGSRPLPPRLLTIAERQGFSVHNMTALSLDEVRRATARVAAVFAGSAAIGARAAELDAAMVLAWGDSVPTANGAASGGDLLRVLPVYWTDPIGVAGPGSFHYELTARLPGVVPAITEGSAYITLDPEDLARLNPDAIVCFVPDDSCGASPRASRLSGLTSPLGRLGLRAVEQGRVVLIDHRLCLMGTPALVEVASELRAAFDPEHDPESGRPLGFGAAGSVDP